MAATEDGANQLERFEARVDRAIASRIESGDVGAEQPQAQPAQADDDLADQRFAESAMLPPHPRERQAPDAHAGSDPEYPQAGDSEDEAMGETLTVAELQRRMHRQSLRGPHPCDSRVPTRTAATGAQDDDAQEDEVTAILAVLGADPKSHRREKKQAVRRLVSEIYSPPRVTAMLKRMTNHGLTPGLAMDLTTNDPDDGAPWDFDVEAKREKALRLQREQKPLFLSGSPMCTRWCSWQHINDKIRDPKVVAQEKKKALMHFEFMTEMYRGQIEGGKFLLHEHP